MTARPLRTLLITGRLGPGGTELALMALARGLAERGAVRPRLAVLAEGGAHTAALRAEGIPVTELGISGPIRRPRSLSRLLRLARLVRDERIDVVHTFLFDADVYGMLAAHLGGPRAVVTTRRAIKSHRPHHVRGYRLTNCLVDRVVANSEAVRRFTLEKERLAPDKTEVIPNGVDASRFASGDGSRFRARLGLDSSRRLVGTVGTLKPVKGQSVLLEAMIPLMRRRPELTLMLAGTAVGSYARGILDDARGAGLDGRVVATGSIDDVADMLAALDLFVLPSLSEGMSNALLEAMAAGAPIVATDVGGNRENLAGGRCGKLVTPGDSKPLAEAIVALIDDDRLRAELGRKAARRAREEYGMERMYERTERLYRDVVGVAG